MRVDAVAKATPPLVAHSWANAVWAPGRRADRYPFAVVAGFASCVLR